MRVDESIAQKLAEKRSRYVARGTSSTHPIFVDRAEGTVVSDVEGKKYLDFTGGVSTLNVGHQHPLVMRAVQAQLERFTHICPLVAMYEPYVELAERLSVLIGGEEAYKALLLTTGSEAIENAIKIARSYTKRTAIVAFTGAFHGRTLLALSLTAAGAQYQQNFGPFAPEIYHTPFPYEYRGWSTERALEALGELFSKQLKPENVAAIIVEPQLGEGGFVPAPARFLQELRRITERNGIVLIADEIQCGFGRTAKMFAYEHAGIQPDLVTVAKSLADGLPLSAVVGKAAIMDAPEPGGLGSTYMGNPVACAAALAVLDIFEKEDLLSRAEASGRQLRDGLLKLQTQFPQIGDVRGLGAMLAAEFVTDRESRTPAPEIAERILENARARGLLLLRCGPVKNIVRFLAPLTASRTEIEQGMAIFGAAVEQAVR